MTGDDRWKLLTARECLDHTTGFPNFRWFNPRGNNKLEFFFTPGTRYAYSGEGLVLLQLVVETVTGKRLDSLAHGWEHFALCLPDQKEAIVVMTNSSNGERIFKELFEKLSGVTIPWEWEQYTPY